MTNHLKSHSGHFVVKMASVFPLLLQIWGPGSARPKRAACVPAHSAAHPASPPAPFGAPRRVKALNFVVFLTDFCSPEVFYLVSYLPVSWLRGEKMGQKNYIRPRERKNPTIPFHALKSGIFKLNF